MGIFFFFLLGLLVGSFLNVVALRMGAGTDFVHGRSQCPRCQALIAWYDNIPLFSFLWLKGKCRSCHTAISWRYPAVELVSGLMYAATFAFLYHPGVVNAVPHTVWLLGLFSFFLVIALCDMESMEIPLILLQMSALWTLGALVFLDWNAGMPLWGSWDAHLFPGLIGALVAWSFFASLTFFSKETWMGWGDVWLAGIIGLAVGIGGILLALTLSFGIGALFAGVLLYRKQAGMGSQVPFGPFLVLGTCLFFFLSQWPFFRYGMALSMPGLAF